MHDDDPRWQRQEAARRGLGADSADRLVAMALREPPPMELPEDFARRVAVLALARARKPSGLVEQLLMLLAPLLLAAALGFAAWWSPAWLPSLWQEVQAQAAPGWLAWLCLALLAGAAPWPAARAALPPPTARDGT